VSRCIVTGAAAGIGLAVAEAFAAEGRAVEGVDLDGGAGGAIPMHRADLSDLAGLERLAQELGAGGPIDVLVHNAGINCTGLFEDSDMESQRRLLAVNLTAPMVLTAKLLARDLLAPGGSLVFVSSLSRFVSYPGAAVYAGSKDGLASYARSLAVALAPRDIHVLTVYPGPTRTEHARRHSPAGSSEKGRMPPEELAHRVVRAVGRRQRVLVPGMSNSVLAAVGHGLPRLGEWAMKKAILEKLDA